MPPKEAVRALPASPPLISLLSSAEVITEPDSRWESGVSYEPEMCGNDRTGTMGVCNLTSQSKTVALGGGAVDVESFIVWAGDSCSSFGFASRDWQGRARRKLAACESRLVERELWRGELSRGHAPDWPNKYLAHSDSDIVTTSQTTPLNALACLEQALAECNCGSQGMIHATPQLVTHWASQQLVRREGNKIFTTLGTVVVPGSGYDGSGPAASAGGDPVAPAGSIWAYATGMVHIRLGPVVPMPNNLNEALNRATNTITYYAERIVEVSWDCCHMAAEIDLDSCDVGS